MLGWTAPTALLCQNEVVEISFEEPSVTEIIRIGVDTSKSVFQLHGVDAQDRPVLRKKLRRREFLRFFANLPSSRIGLEACGGSHHWARELTAVGHEAVLLPAQYAKQYLMRGKNDPADAEAICEAMGRPRVQRRFVPVKTAEQQAMLMLIGTRDRLVRTRTQLSNSIRGHAGEFGLVAAKGLDKIEPLLERIASDPTVPALAQELFAAHGVEYAELKARLRAIDAKLAAWHRSHELSKRLAEIPGIGVIGATRLAIKVTNPHAFRSGRDFSAWIGLTPKDHSTAGKQRLGVITRAGDESLRQTLVLGATAMIQHLRKGRGHPSPWLVDLIKRKPPKLAAVALANKTARIAWKLMVSGERYRADAEPGRFVPATGSVAPGSRRQGRCAPPAAVARRPALTTLASGAPDCRCGDEPHGPSGRATMTANQPD
jgi:transposase